MSEQSKSFLYFTFMTLSAIICGWGLPWLIHLQ
jgi:hypothetical protein